MRMVRNFHGHGLLWMKKHNEYISKIYGHIPHYSEDYIDCIFTGPGNTIKNGAIYNLEHESAFLNAKNGLRDTIGQPETWTNSVYVLGSSWVFGVGTEDAHTIASFLQDNLNRNNSSLRVVNMGVRGSVVYNDFLIYKNIDFKEGDWCILFFRASAEERAMSLQLVKYMNELSTQRGIVFLLVFYPRLRNTLNTSEYEQILYGNTYAELVDGKRERVRPLVKKYAPPECTAYLTAHGCRWIDMQPYFNRPHKMEISFMDKNHVGPAGTKRIADVLHTVVDVHKNSQEDMGTVKKHIYTYIKNIVAKSQRKKLEPWLKSIACDKFSGEGVIGSIVMNCNPFTYGHLHLIEYAMEKVDYLYIFVVQEDKSIFPFPDRIELVRKGTSFLGDSVKVLPSGSYIISSFSFPEYFTKEIVHTPVDSSYDIAIFGSIIAPELNISHRFLGEEPICQVTRAYNETMLKMLPPMGVAVHIISRKESDSEVISASRVRALLRNDDFNSLKKLVPPTTLQYLSTGVKNSSTCG